MKFGKQLANEAHGPWAYHYVDYKALKQILKQISPDATIDNPGKSSEANVHLDGLFVSSLMLQIHKVNRFYCATADEYATRLQAIQPVLLRHSRNVKSVTEGMCSSVDVEAGGGTSCTAPATATPDAGHDPKLGDLPGQLCSSGANGADAFADDSRQHDAEDTSDTHPVLEEIWGQIQESAFSSLSSDADVSNAILAHFGLLPEGPEPPKPGTLLAGALPSGAVPLQPQSPEHAAALLAFLELCSQVDLLRKFAILNYLAVVKVVKKHDKISPLRLSNAFNDLVMQQPFYASQKLIDTFLACQSLVTDIISLDASDACMRPTNYRCSLCGSHLAMGIVVAGSQRHCHKCLASIAQKAIADDETDAHLQPKNLTLEPLLSDAASQALARISLPPVVGEHLNTKGPAAAAAAVASHPLLTREGSWSQPLGNAPSAPVVQAGLCDRSDSSSRMGVTCTSGNDARRFFGGVPTAACIQQHHEAEIRSGVMGNLHDGTVPIRSTVPGDSAGYASCHVTGNFNGGSGSDLGFATRPDAYNGVTFANDGGRDIYRGGSGFSGVAATCDGGELARGHPNTSTPASSDPAALSADGSFCWRDRSAAEVGGTAPFHVPVDKPGHENQRLRGEQQCSPRSTAPMINGVSSTPSMFNALPTNGVGDGRWIDPGLLGSGSCGSYGEVGGNGVAGAALKRAPSCEYAASDAEPDAKKAKKWACQECHRAKAACEGEPCRRCIRLNKTCVPQIRPVGGRRRRGVAAKAAAGGATTAPSTPTILQGIHEDVRPRSALPPPQMMTSRHPVMQQSPFYQQFEATQTMTLSSAKGHETGIDTRPVPNWKLNGNLGLCDIVGQPKEYVAYGHTAEGFCGNLAGAPSTTQNKA